MFLLCHMIFVPWHYHASCVRGKQTAIVLLFFFPFVLNFDVTRYFNNRLLLVVCSVHLNF